MADAQSKTTLMDDEIIARAIDPEAWRQSAWSDHRIGKDAGAMLTGMQEDRQAKALAKARSALSALRAAGRRVQSV